MGTQKNSTAFLTNERELRISELTKIDGIARKTAEALYDINIRIYADLIQYLSQHTAEEISETLKERGVNRPAAFIEKEKWSRQAEELAQQSETAQAPSEEEVQFEAKPEEVLESAPSHQHDAAFSLFFDYVADENGMEILQTKIYDEKNYGNEAVFTGAEPIPWLNWLLQRIQRYVGLEEVPIQFEALAPPADVTPLGLQVEVLDVQLSEAVPTLPIAKKRLAATVQFQISGCEAETLAKETNSIQIQVHTINLESGEWRLVSSERGHLEPEVYEYTSRQEFPMPETGRYEITSSVLLLPPGGRLACHQGPTFKVK
jgi:hypothetical protein